MGDVFFVFFFFVSEVGVGCSFTLLTDGFGCTLGSTAAGLEVLDEGGGGEGSVYGGFEGDCVQNQQTGRSERMMLSLLAHGYMLVQPSVAAIELMVSYNVKHGSPLIGCLVCIASLLEVRPGARYGYLKRPLLQKCSLSPHNRAREQNVPCASSPWV